MSNIGDMGLEKDTYYSYLQIYIECILYSVTLENIQRVKKKKEKKRKKIQGKIFLLSSKIKSAYTLVAISFGGYCRRPCGILGGIRKRYAKKFREIS